MFTGAFWKDAGERAVRAGAAAMLTVMLVTGFNITSGDDLSKAGRSFLSGAAISLVMSAAGSQVKNAENPSFLK